MEEAMLYLQIAERSGSALYLDVHSVERRLEQGRPVLRVAGILGDGCYEGEVQVNCTEQVDDVTFADAWLNRRALDTFFSRIDPKTICAALAVAVKGRYQ
jgi:hypothetical protein